MSRDYGIGDELCTIYHCEVSRECGNTMAEYSRAQGGSSEESMCSSMIRIVDRQAGDVVNIEVVVLLGQMLL